MPQSSVLWIPIPQADFDKIDFLGRTAKQLRAAEWSVLQVWVSVCQDQGQGEEDEGGHHVSDGEAQSWGESKRQGLEQTFKL